MPPQPGAVAPPRAVDPSTIGDAHEGLAPLTDAARAAHAKVTVLPVPMHWRARAWLPRPVELVAKTLTFLGPHLRLTAQLWRHRDQDLVVVREFLTTILAVVWPLIWPLRRRVFFLINHNLQEAHQKGLERLTLRWLHRTGCRFACFETTAGFAEIGIIPDASRFLVLPHPLDSALAPTPEAPPPATNPPAAGTGAAERLPVVGVVGAVRAEKGSEQILEALLAARRGQADGAPVMELLLGCPQAEVRERWGARGYQLIDTSERSGYLAALDRCDVVILNYRRDRYQYRPSGVAADALGRGTAVVCPDLPLMRHQLTTPTKVGALFAGLDQLPAAVAEAVALGPTLAEALAAQRQARDANAIAALFDRFVERQRHPN